VEMKRKARDAVLAMVEREREGEQIDRALLKNVSTNFLKQLSPKNFTFLLLTTKFLNLKMLRLSSFYLGKKQRN